MHLIFLSRQHNNHKLRLVCNMYTGIEYLGSVHPSGQLSNMSDLSKLFTIRDNYPY